jgi:probable phosphoglycerate mutase
VTNFLLIRHGLHVFGSDRLAGRTPGVDLSPDGRAQSEQLADRLAGVQLHAIYFSPIERTVQTHAPLAARQGVTATVSDALVEIDYGDWTGRSLDELAEMEEWRRWNSFRSGTRVPNGESMLEIQARVVAEMQRLASLHVDENVALVSHGDVIKAALAYALGVPLDLFQRIEVSPASVSVVQIAAYGPWVLCVNNAGELAELPVFAGPPSS